MHYFHPVFFLVKGILTITDQSPLIMRFLCHCHMQRLLQAEEDLHYALAALERCYDRLGERIERANEPPIAPKAHNTVANCAAIAHVTLVRCKVSFSFFFSNAPSWHSVSHLFFFPFYFTLLARTFGSDGEDARAETAVHAELPLHRPNAVVPLPLGAVLLALAALGRSACRWQCAPSTAT